MLPSNTSPESLPDKFNDFFVHKTEESKAALNLTDKSLLSLLSSLAQSLQIFN